MIRKILIANRGEIAVRIIRACKELGIKTAAIYSEADIGSLHTILADESYLIGSAPSSQSYLNKEKIIQLAKEINADAIHPGYGFLSENSDFIKMVEESGIKFIGPSSKSVEMMGSKTAARSLMQKHKVPIVPGTTEPIKTVSEGLSFADEIGFPVLIKASAGGGGKGMRKVFSKDEFDSAFESTKREALKAFGNDDVYIEKLIENPKHIEVQIIADEFGNYRHLFERECSIQRRHQKIIEESPSAFLDDLTRKAITEAAVNAAKACNYFNAGTIEFLMDKDKKFYFLEMNTRLQVEHPVTELVTGIDLVREQIMIASGEKISFEQKDIQQNGVAIECRVYAEDSSQGFLPSTGKLKLYKEPSGPNVRVDSGVMVNSEITVHYDPMISKLICWGKNRDEVISRSLRALDEYYIGGVSTNISFLKFILNRKEFRESSHNINSVEQKFLKEFEEQTQNISDNENEIAAAILSAYLKSKVKQKVTSDIYITNKWRDLLYE
ncbi:MAG: acetyl-CoA carboxylase biotin carboxylase subunit [Ignavibacterium sp.]|uniref:acetyl-CoA carboxylase biotin carboxylase subunit n=1 Tax=Ignavibacterium sp. TaxID=2651167 RepID=UPI003299AE27